MYLVTNEFEKLPEAIVIVPIQPITEIVEDISSGNARIEDIKKKMNEEFDRRRIAAMQSEGGTYPYED